MTFGPFGSFVWGVNSSTADSQRSCSCVWLPLSSPSHLTLVWTNPKESDMKQVLPDCRSGLAWRCCGMEKLTELNIWGITEEIRLEQGGYIIHPPQWNQEVVRWNWWDAVEEGFPDHCDPDDPKILHMVVVLLLIDLWTIQSCDYTLIILIKSFSPGLGTLRPKVVAESFLWF